MVAPLPSSAGNRFRQRKISTKQTLQIFKQSQISDIDNEDLQQRDLQEIETGVEKNEEEEVHLQKILKNTGITSTAEAYIPTPDASKLWPEAHKYYKGKFLEPESYIKSSCQVEDYSGCLYNMDEVDEEFLTKYNKELETKKIERLTEDEFEIIFYNYEKVISEKQPFLVTDPHQILPLDEVKMAVFKFDKSSVENITKSLSKELDLHPFITQYDARVPKEPRTLEELIEKYGEEVYEHFKTRKIERGGKTVTPILKFTGEDDSDAYICFRQRQFRQQRKTRRADTQSSEKLVKLYLELKQTRELSLLVAQREKKRLEALQAEREIFELRCKVKNYKRDLGITDSDEDLITHKKKKVVPPPPSETKEEIKKDKKGLSKVGNNANTQEKAKAHVSTSSSDLAGSESNQQQFQPYVKLPPSKIPDMELETVQHLLKNKDVSMQNFVEEKLKKRKEADIGFTNFTDCAYNPFFDLGVPNQNIIDSSHTPYSSIISSFYDVQSLGYIQDVDKYIDSGFISNDKDAFQFKFHNNHGGSRFTKKPPQQPKFVPERYNPLFQKTVNTSDPVFTLRKRIGRYGQVYIDRKSLVKKPEDDETDENNDKDDVEMIDARERFEDRWKYDSDLSLLDINDNEPFSDDPSKLNSIPNDTQVIRFGGMLLSKAYETLKESIVHQRQQLYYQQLQRMHAQQQLAQRQQQAQAQAQGTGANGQSQSTVQGSSSQAQIQQPKQGTPGRQHTPIAQPVRSNFVNRNNGSIPNGQIRQPQPQSQPQQHHSPRPSQSPAMNTKYNNTPIKTEH